MTKNIKYGEPPTFKGNVEEWVRDTERYLRTIHQTIYGLGGDGGELDGTDNITSAEYPGEANGTPTGNAAVINALTANLQVTGLVKAEET